MPKCGNKEPQSSNLDCETGSFNTPSRGKIDMGGTLYREAREYCHYYLYLKML